MPHLDWQKSSYCAEGNACLNIATAPDGTVRLRESDDPAVILTATTQELRRLILRLQATNSLPISPNAL